MFTIKDASNNEITSISGLEYKTVTDGKGASISGFEYYFSLILLTLSNVHVVRLISSSSLHLLLNSLKSLPFMHIVGAL